MPSASMCGVSRFRRSRSTSSTFHASQAPDELFDALTLIVGPEYATKDDEERVVHTYGKSIRDLIRLRAEHSAAHP